MGQIPRLDSRHRPSRLVLFMTTLNTVFVCLLFMPCLQLQPRRPRTSWRNFVDRKARGTVGRPEVKWYRGPNNPNFTLTVNFSFPPTFRLWFKQNNYWLYTYLKSYEINFFFFLPLGHSCLRYILFDLRTHPVWCTNNIHHLQNEANIRWNLTF